MRMIGELCNTLEELVNTPASPSGTGESA